MKHTPNDLSVMQSKKPGEILIVSGVSDDPSVTQVPIVCAVIPAEIGGYEPERQAFAESVTIAVNNHDKLVKLLTLYAYPGDYESRPSQEEIQKEAREVLEQVEAS